MYRISITNTVTGETENIEADAFFFGAHKIGGGVSSLASAECGTLDAISACAAALNEVERFARDNKIPWEVIAIIAIAENNLAEVGEEA